MQIIIYFIYPAPNPNKNFNLAIKHQMLTTDFLHPDGSINGELFIHYWINICSEQKLC